MADSPLRDLVTEAGPGSAASWSLRQAFSRQETPSAARAARGTIFSPQMFSLKLDCAERQDGRLEMACAPAVVQRFREALLSRSNDLPSRIRTLLSGHDSNGNALEGVHLAIVPLPSVDFEPDCRLAGIGLAFPRGVSDGDRDIALQAALRVRYLKLGRLGVWQVQSGAEADTAWTAWPDGATHWSTVTPVVFDRHPKAKDRTAYELEAASIVAASCSRIGLPEPVKVAVTSGSAHAGTPPAHAFPRLERKDGSFRRHAHATLIFREPVCGPVLIGAGRFRGYGFCRPSRGESA